MMFDHIVTLEASSVEPTTLRGWRRSRRQLGATHTRAWSHSPPPCVRP